VAPATPAHWTPSDCHDRIKMAAGDCDCSICFEEMTAETGHSVLGCGHRFHMLCVVNWFQEQEGTPTCPCCRRQAGRFDNVPVWPEDQVDGEEEEEEEVDEDEMDEDEVDEDEEEEEEEEDLGADFADMEENVRLNWRRAEGGQWECYAIPTAPDIVWDPADETDEVPTEIAAGATALQRIWRGWRERRKWHDARLREGLKETWMMTRFMAVV